MILNPSSFSYERLSSLKYKELQKLSVQFHVHKRWAKKQELIDNLLALSEATVDKEQEDEQEWRSASSVFSDLKLNNENEGNKRLTYNISTRSSAEHNDPHLTFEIPQNGKNLLSEKINSRETYDIPPSGADFGIELTKESIFEIPPEKMMLDNNDSRATFDICKKGTKLLEDSIETVNIEYENFNNKKIKSSNVNIKINDSEIKQKTVLKKFDINVKNKKEEKDEKKKLEIKMLTIPYARVTKRTRAGEASKNDSSPIKMSRKSINIKKSTRLPASKTSLMQSLAFSSVKKSANGETLMKNQQEKVFQSKVPIRLPFAEQKSKPIDDDNKGNVKILRKQISKIVGETCNKIPKTAKVNFRTPPHSITKSSRIGVLKKTPLRKNGKLNSNAVQTTDSKPIRATKMPDFGKIHKKQFEQMDSLHEYLKKKEDRIRKLFGTPQPGQHLYNLNKSTPTIFHFQSTTKTINDKENECLKIIPTTPLTKEND